MAGTAKATQVAVFVGLFSAANTGSEAGHETNIDQKSMK